MKRIVVLSTIYTGIPSANGICARNIVSELINLGNKVDVICYEGDISNVSNRRENIHTVKRMKIKKKLNMFDFRSLYTKFFQLLNMNIEYLLDMELVNAYYNKLIEINRINPINTIIAMYFPLECLHAAFLFKYSHRNVCVLGYELDSIEDGVANGKIQKYYNKICQKWLNEVYLYIDYIIVMKGHENNWRTIFKRYEEKLIILDIPVLTEKNKTTNIPCDPIKMIYAGLIEKKYRSPSYLLNVLSELSKKINFEFYFFSKGDCENEIKQYSRNYKNIFQRGYVFPEILEEYIQDASILVNIGNSVSRSLPSKLINYISYGKPIIHFTLQDNDICKEYLNNYELALVIEKNLSIVEASNLILQFIEEVRHKVTIKFDDIRKIYYMNDPKYSAKVINNLVKIGKNR